MYYAINTEERESYDHRRLVKADSGGIKRQVPDHKSSVSVLKHAITIILNVLCIVVFTLLISIFTGNMKQAVIALVGFAVLRQFSGGYHLKTGQAVLHSRQRYSLWCLCGYGECRHSRNYCSQSVAGDAVRSQPN